MKNITLDMRSTVFKEEDKGLEVGRLLFIFHENGIETVRTESLKDEYIMQALAKTTGGLI